MTVPPNPLFDRLFDEAVPHILAGTHRRDAPPVDGGRWPVTVLARPPLPVRAHLESLMHEAARLAGHRHFRTGRADSVHLTIRALEPFRAAADVGDPVVRGWSGALARTAAAAASFRLIVTGLTLTSGGVLAQVETHDDRPWELMERLRAELGDLAWFEDGMRRDIWYCSLLHFTHGVADPEGLVEWVRARRTMTPVSFEVSSIELVRFRHTSLGELGHYMRPETWATVPLGRPAGSLPAG